MEEDKRLVNLQPAPPFEPGNSAALKHGTFSVPRFARRAEEIADEVRGVVPARTEADEPAIRLLAVTLAQIEAGTLHVAEHGLVDGKGQPQPVLKPLTTMVNTAARLLDRLGMTPAGRAALGLDLARREAVRVSITRLAALAEAESK